jgi:hypothetical protein
MSDVEVYTQPAASELEQWGRDAHLISAVAVNLVKTNFVPSSYNGDPAQVTAAILTGQEIGLAPMAALRSIDIIQGVPAMRAIALRALVQSHGHEIWTEETTSQRAVVKAQRKGSTKVETSSWDLDRARVMNLLGKDNWKKQPQAMLLARATSEAARLVAADVLLGVPYSVEEIQDLDETPAVEPTRRPSTRAARKPLPEKLPAEEPALDGETLAIQAAEAARLDGIDSGSEQPLTEDEQAELDAREASDAIAQSSAPAVLSEPDVEWDPPIEPEP